MKKRASLIAVALVFGLGISLLAAADAPAPPAAGKITGELVDSSCYIKSRAKGEKHAQCAVECAKAGIPLALLEDGTDKVIWLTGAKDMSNPNEALIPYAGKKVTLTGKWFERGGAKVFAY